MRIKATLFVLTSLAYGCKKEEPLPVTVEFNAFCFRCAVAYGINGSELGRVTIGTPFRTWTAPAEVGDEYWIRATPVQLSNVATAVWAKVDGFQQAYIMVQPNDSSRLGVPIEVRRTVPELDAYGVPK